MRCLPGSVCIVWNIRVRPGSRLRMNIGTVIDRGIGFLTGTSPILSKTRWPFYILVYMLIYSAVSGYRQSSELGSWRRSILST